MRKFRMGREEGQNDVFEGNCHTIKKDIQSGSLRESTQSINPFLSDVVVVCMFICVYFFSYIPLLEVLRPFSMR